MIVDIRIATAVVIIFTSKISACKVSGINATNKHSSIRRAALFSFILCLLLEIVNFVDSVNTVDNPPIVFR